MRPATITTRDRGTDIDLTVSGEIDLHNAARFQEQLGAAVDNNATRVRVDLGGVGYIDSAGIRALVLFASRLHTAQIDLRVLAPPESVSYRVLLISGLGSLIGPPAHESVAEP